MSRTTKPYLLSTTATLRRFKILDYDGYDFSMGRKNRRKYTVETMKRLCIQYLYSVIVPNAIIAKDRIAFSDRKEAVCDVLKALAYAMTEGRSREDKEAFKLMVKSENEWYFEKVTRPFQFYVFDLAYSRKKKKFADERMPEERRWTIRRYVLEKMHPKKLRPYTHSSTPALNELVTAYSSDRSISGYTIAQFKERFGCSNRTIEKFKAYLRERTKDNTTTDLFLVLPRPQGRKKHDGNTSAATKTGTA